MFVGSLQYNARDTWGKRIYVFFPLLSRVPLIASQIPISAQSKINACHKTSNFFNCAPLNRSLLHEDTTAEGHSVCNPVTWTMPNFARFFDISRAIFSRYRDSQPLNFHRKITHETVRRQWVRARMQLSYWSYVTAFLQTDLFLVSLFFCERKAVLVYWRSDVD